MSITSLLKNRSGKVWAVASGVAVVVLVIGMAILRSGASGFFGATEAEGAIAGNATIVSDASASGGKALQFNAPAASGSGGGSGSSWDPCTSSTPQPATTTKPTASNTGVSSSASLTVVTGNQTYKPTAGCQIIKDKDFHGFVTIGDSGQTGVIVFEDCIFRGTATGSNNALLDTQDRSGTSKVIVMNSEFVPSNPSATIDGLWLNYTDVYNANVHGSVDGIKASSGSRIQNSYIHDMQWFASDPNQGGGETHNDAIQILDGTGIVVTGNTLAAGAQANSAIQITQDFGAVSNVTITNNWADYGGCTFNLAQKPGNSLVVGPVTGNRFGRNQGYSGCAILIGTKTSISQNSGNVWDDTSQPIPAPQQHD